MSSSGWDDGKIRAFTPESGRLLYAIENAHKSGVTAVATTSDSKHIISGGGEGEVRVWEMNGHTWKMKGSIKEHTGNNKQNKKPFFHFLSIFRFPKQRLAPNVNLATLYSVDYCA